MVEVPPKVLGAVNDFWYRWVADIGITGADKGAGGKYLVLPPGYQGTIPKGYVVVKPKTYGNPNERWQKILADAANIGAVTARTLALKIREPEAYFYPNSSWRLPFFGGSPTVRKVVR